MDQVSTFARAMAVFVLFAAFAGLSFALAVEMHRMPLFAASAPAALVTPVKPGVTQPKPAAGSTDDLASRNLLFPLQGYDRAKMIDNFDELRGGQRRHEAIDIMAARGTPVLAVEDGRIAKLFTSKAGGLTIYQFDPGEKFAYYYAHLETYAEGLREGMEVKRGDVIGFVGSSGNAPAHAPHLHFTIFQLGPDKRWWKGQAVNPYPYLSQRR